MDKMSRPTVAETSKTQRMVVGAFFMALTFVMPFLTGQIPGVGSRLLPMHFPVLLCGFVCGWKYGLLVGFISPLFRSAMLGMPPMMPTAATMAFELAVYGAVSGWLYYHSAKKMSSVYISLLGSMIAGRVVWGLVAVPLYGVAGAEFSWQLFVAGGFLNAIPGIVLQIVLIPIVVMALKKARVME